MQTSADSERTEYARCLLKISLKELSFSDLFPDVFKTVQGFLQGVILLCEMKPDKIIHVLTEKA